MALFSDLPLWMQSGFLGPAVGATPVPAFAAAPAAESGDMLSNISGGISRNPNLLMALGAGIMSGGFGKGLEYAMSGGQLDQKQRALALQQGSTYAALKARGLSDADALAAMANPEMLKALLPVAVPKFDQFNNGQFYGRFNSANGQTDVQGAAPKFETLSPGQVGGYAAPPVSAQRPSAASAPSGYPIVFGDGSTAPHGSPASLPPATPGFTPVASGGPRLPPEGFDWVDPRDPSKGQRPIAGGPATQMTAETGGRLALIQASLPGLAEAKAYFLDPNNALINKSALGAGLFGAATQVAGQATGSFEIGRQQRNVRLAAEAALRTATGATAPPDEVKRYADFYMPSISDTLATRQQKLEALDRFIGYASRNIASGRMPPPEAFMQPGSDKGQDRAPQRIRLNAQGAVVQ